MLSLIDEKISNRENFAIETTLSGLNYARRIPRWQRAGYHVKLIFLSLPTADLAVARVKGRVRDGGHNILEPVIRRRFDAGLRNFDKIYRHLVNGWLLYDNSAYPPQLIAQGGELP